MARKRPPMIGEKGLIAAVVDEATRDCQRGKDDERRIDAMRFYYGDWYLHCLGLLDKPASWLPTSVNPLDIATQAVTDVMRGDPKLRHNALRYFRGDVYQAHLEQLNKPASWVPKVDND